MKYVKYRRQYLYITLFTKKHCFLKSRIIRIANSVKKFLSKRKKEKRKKQQNWPIWVILAVNRGNSSSNSAGIGRWARLATSFSCLYSLFPTPTKFSIIFFVFDLKSAWISLIALPCLCVCVSNSSDFDKRSSTELFVPVCRRKCKSK